MRLTPLYAEIFEVVTILNQKNKTPVTPDIVVKNVKLTKHSSRVRLGLEWLTKKGLLCSSGACYTLQKNIVDL
ncbi:hypothetical protein JCM30760_26560 [Thiomicrorhabdus hydrogeniphila]